MTPWGTGALRAVGAPSSRDELAVELEALEVQLAGAEEGTGRSEGRKSRRRGWLVRRALAVADVGGLVLAFVVAESLANVAGGGDHVSRRAEVVLFFLTLPAWIVVAKLYGLYERDEERAGHSTVDDLVGLFHMVTVGAWSFLVGSWLTGLAHPLPERLLVFWALAISTVAMTRAAARAFARRRPVYRQNTVIVGIDSVGQSVARKIRKHPEYGLNVLGFVDGLPSGSRLAGGDQELLGTTDRLPEIVRRLDVERVIIAFSDDSHEGTLELIRSLGDLEVQIDVVPRFFELVAPTTGIHQVEGVPLMGLTPLRLSRSSRLLKRALDVLVSLLGLVVLAPVFVVIAAAIKLDSSGPVFFRQLRVGSHGRAFRIVKFRTMVADAEELKPSVAHLNKHAQAGGDPRMFKIENDPRVTRVGRILRRYSLDELPQLFNVLTGAMSLVGPRPLIFDEDQHLVGRWARHRLRLKPGVTGVWQVLGRDDIPFSEMVRLDYLYVTTWSLQTDIKLLLQTVPSVMRAARG